MDTHVERRTPYVHPSTPHEDYLVRLDRHGLLRYPRAYKREAPHPGPRQAALQRSGFRLNAALSPEHLAHPAVGLLDELRHDVLVARGHRGRGPAEHTHNDALVDALNQQQRRCGVARVVESSVADTQPLQKRSPAE